MFRSVSVNALQLLPVHESRACHLACVPVCECASASQVVLSDSVSEVQPGGGSL